MITPVATDITRLLHDLINLLQPFATSRGVVLGFKPKQKNLTFLLRPDLVIVDVTNLLCNIISHLPKGNTITIEVGIEKNECTLQVHNTGVDLSLMSEITKSCRQPLVVKGDAESKQTLFVWVLRVLLPVEPEAEIGINTEKEPKTMIPDYYDEIRKRLRSHFSKADNLVAQLSLQYPREAAFLQKINAVIVDNIENDLFDASALSREMNMSRASLFRRLKPLIRQAPATYIKSIRLQKAKDLLETSDISVGEAALKTGFQTQSHFTKAFTDMFGFLPSSIRLKDRRETKE